MSLLGLLGSVSCGFQLLSTFLPQLDLGCPGLGGAERGRVECRRQCGWQEGAGAVMVFYTLRLVLSMCSVNVVDSWKMLEVKPPFPGWGCASGGSGVVR